jgi:hypothetical protein
MRPVLAFRLPDLFAVRGRDTALLIPLLPDLATALRRPVRPMRLPPAAPRLFLLGFAALTRSFRFIVQHSLLGKYNLEQL